MATPQTVASPFAGQIDFPAVDVLSYIFSNNSPARRQAEYFDAADPSLSFGLDAAELYAKQLGCGLRKIGLGPGDKVLVTSPNQLYFPIALWGILAAGCVFTGSSPSASVIELSYQLKDSEAKAVFASPGQLQASRRAAANVGLSPDRVFVLDKPGRDGPVPGSEKGGEPSWLDIWVPASDVRDWRWKAISTQEEAENTTAIINYSSGTTGLPKGVELSHFNLVSNVEQLMFKRCRVGADRLGQERAARLQESGERWLAPLPMYHAFTYYAMLAPRLGAKVFIMTHFNPRQFLAYVDIYRVTFINVVPALLEKLIKIQGADRFNLKSLCSVGSGAAPLALDVARDFERTFLRPGVHIKQGWGMTETTCNVTGFSPDDDDDGSSIGWLNPGCEGRIVPVPDRDFGNIERAKGVTVGEIWVAGPNIMKGYWKRPDETSATITIQDGRRWLRTGDVGYFDSRGCLFIVDRIKELIKVNGLQVSPAEIEATLKQHPGVADAAVVSTRVNDREAPRAVQTG
ncbi:hypothetical protein CEP51_012624 [Fusarium floridanum]|uniref:AMP-dependent synthetase/ligase domain-containing protein n=1 Tax=Fusarium floridanum TaxID=1325733 RepID=A0A428QQV6_9HYPO|nr:hypothetical protein CEP51_012624 [Fusarium floridanum]